MVRVSFVTKSGERVSFNAGGRKGRRGGRRATRGERRVTTKSRRTRKPRAKMFGPADAPGTKGQNSWNALRARAKVSGIAGYGKMKKEELTAAMQGGAHSGHMTNPGGMDFMSA